MKFENVSVSNFRGAVRGMRNPKNSWNLIDSVFGLVYLEDSVESFEVARAWALVKFPDIKNHIAEARSYIEEKEEWLLNNGILKSWHKMGDVAFIGPNDMKLMQQLIVAGPEHRKFMRQIFVCVDITAPIFW